MRRRRPRTKFIALDSRTHAHTHAPTRTQKQAHREKTGSMRSSQNAPHLFRHDEGHLHVSEVRFQLGPDGAGHGDLRLLRLFCPNRGRHSDLFGLDFAALRTAAASVVAKDVPGGKTQSTPPEKEWAFVKVIDVVGWLIDRSFCSVTGLSVSVYPKRLGRNAPPQSMLVSTKGEKERCRAVFYRCVGRVFQAQRNFTRCGASKMEDILHSCQNASPVK